MCVNNGKDTQLLLLPSSLSAAHSSSSPGCSLFHLTPPVKPLHKISPKKGQNPPPKTIHTIQQPYHNLRLSERRQQENSGGGKKQKQPRLLPDILYVQNTPRFSLRHFECCGCVFVCFFFLFFFVLSSLPVGDWQPES